MSISRNDPCPCGSGKKYKKCCGDPANQPAYTTEEVTNIQLDLAAAANKDSRKDFSHYYRRIYRPNYFPYAWHKFVQNLALADFLLHGNERREWMNIHQQIEHNSQHPRLQRLYSNWTGHNLSLFRLNKMTDEWYEVTDLLSEEVHHIEPLSFFRDLQENIVFLAFLVPVEDKWYPMLGLLPFHPDFGDDVINSVTGSVPDNEADKAGWITHHLPDVLRTLKDDLQEKYQEADNSSTPSETGSDAADDTNETAAAATSGLNDEQQKVVEALESSDQLSKDAVSTASELWTRFCEQENPVIRKPEAQAAALEYAVGGGTQKEIAERYGVASSTIRTQWKKMEPYTLNENA